MNDGTTLARVKALIGDVAGIPADEITDDLAIGEPVMFDGVPVGLDLDSLSRLQLVVDLSEHFGIEIPDADADKPEMGTPAGIAAYVDARLNAGAAVECAEKTAAQPFAISTGDPRFDPKKPVTINGFAYLPAPPNAGV